MYTPYDWQEGIGNRASYIEGKLAQGAPVLGVSLAAGIVLLTFRRQARKLHEIYDRLAYAGIGHQSDVETIRNAALEFAHREGYNRSEDDVTIHRVVVAMSEPIKRAFGDFASSPFVARCLFAELGATADSDQFYSLDYDGNYSVSQGAVVLTGSQRIIDEASALLTALPKDLSIDEAVTKLTSIWKDVVADDESAAAFVPEALLIERDTERVDRFRFLSEPTA